MRVATRIWKQLFPEKGKTTETAAQREDTGPEAGQQMSFKEKMNRMLRLASQEPKPKPAASQVQQQDEILVSFYTMSLNCKEFIYVMFES